MIMGMPYLNKEKIIASQRRAEEISLHLKVAYFAPGSTTQITHWVTPKAVTALNGAWRKERPYSRSRLWGKQHHLFRMTQTHKGIIMLWKGEDCHMGFVGELNNTY